MTYTPTTYTDYKNSARAATTGDISLAAPGNTLDGVAMASGNRVLVKSQTQPLENGIYTWNGAASAMTRAMDGDQNKEISSGMQTYVEEGTVNGGSVFTVTTTGSITLGSTSIVFTNLLGAHTGDTTDAHAGTAITNTPAGSIAAVTVQAAINELDGDLTTHKASSDHDSRYYTEAEADALLATNATNDRARANHTGTQAGTTVTNTPAGSIAATTVQAAIDELDGEKVAKAGDAMTGALTNTSDITSRQGAAAQIGLTSVGGFPTIRWGSDSNVDLQNTATDILRIASGDKFQQNTAPSVGDDLVNKTYVDAADALKAPIEVVDRARLSDVFDANDYAQRAHKEALQLIVSLERKLDFELSEKADRLQSEQVLAHYKTLMEATGYMAAGMVAGTYFADLFADTIMRVSGYAAAFSNTNKMRIAASMYDVPGYTTRLKVLSEIVANGAASNVQYNWGLYPVTTSGPAGGLVHTLGTVVTGSQTGNISAGANSAGAGLSGAFDVPAADFYVLGCLTSDTLTASSVVGISARLMISHERK